MILYNIFVILLKDDVWEIKETVRKGKGIFVKKDISKGTVIGDYIGKIIHPQDAIVNEENFYLMYYHDRAAISPDLEKSGMHLLNHSCVPNSWLYIYHGHTLVFVRRRISKGEELTIPYLLAPQDKFCKPCLHICKCGNLFCIGTMHLSKKKYDAWRDLSKRWARKTKRARIRYGKVLPMLFSYPKKISGDYLREVNKQFR